MYGMSILAWVPNMYELLLLLALAFLFFGRKLPELGKSLGQSVVEFKKGLKGVEDDPSKTLGQDQSQMLPPPSGNNNQSPGQPKSNG